MARGAPGRQTDKHMPVRRRLAIVAVAFAAALTLLLGVVLVLNGLGSAFASTEHRERSFPAPVERVEIDVIGGDVEVLARPRQRAVRTSRETKSFLGSATVTEELHGGVLHLRARCDLGFIGTCETNYRVEVPPGVSVHTRSIAGDVLITGVEGDIDVRTTSGDIEMSGLRSRKTRAKSTAGEVTIGVRRVPDRLQARTTAGDVKLVVPAGTYSVEVDTGAGDDTVSGVIDDPAAGHAITARTTAGDVTIRGR